MEFWLSGEDDKEEENKKGKELVFIQLEFCMLCILIMVCSDLCARLLCAST
jgi:hypothetical protein